MANKTVSIPLGMLSRKFYCHRCGQQLLRHKSTKLYQPGDPEYKKHAVRKTGNQIEFLIGSVEVTEYDFRCPQCNTFTQYKEQLVIENIQKRLGNHNLSQSELRSQEAYARDAINRRKTLLQILCWIVSIVLSILAYRLSA